MCVNLLQKLGLRQHADTFEREEIELDILPTLSDADLVALGVGHAESRRVILAAAAQPVAPPQRRSPVKGVLPLQSVENHPRRQKRLNAGGAKPGSTANTRPAAPQLTLSLPDAGSRSGGPGLGLAPPKPAARSGPAAVTLLEMAAAAQATAGQRMPEHDAATPDSCRAAEQLLFHILHPAAAPQAQKFSQNSQNGDVGAFSASTLSTPCTSDRRQRGVKRVRRAESLWVHAGACAAVAGLPTIEQRLQQRMAARDAATAAAAEAAVQAAQPQAVAGQQASKHVDSGSSSRKQQGTGAQGARRQQQRQQRSTGNAAPAVGSVAPARQSAAQAPSTTAGVRLAALREELSAAQEVVKTLRELVREAEIEAGLLPGNASPDEVITLE